MRISDWSSDVCSSDLGPSQQRRHNQADALARPRRGEAQHVLRAIMPKVMPLVSAEHHAVIGKQTGPRYFAAVRPPRRAERPGLLGLSRPPDRHGDGDDHRKDSTRRRAIGAGQEEGRRVAVEAAPPEEKGRGRREWPWKLGKG